MRMQCSYFLGCIMRLVYELNEGEEFAEPMLLLGF